MAESIASHPEHKDDEFHTEKLREIFPDFLWLSRDSFLQYEDDSGKKISPTDYLSKYVLVPSDEPKPTQHDVVVNALTTLFSSIHCLQIPCPADDPLDVESESNKKFDAKVNESIEFILQSIKPKLGGNKKPLNGAILADLAREYCNAINQPNSIPNIELSWISATESVLEKIAAKYVDDYDERMQKIFNDRLPVEEGPISKKESLLPLENYNDKVVEPSTVTIQSAHQFSFSILYHCLKEEVLFYMPRTSQAGDFNQRHEKVLDGFKTKIVIIESNGNGVTVKGGLLQKYIKENYTSSKIQCEQIFEMLYSDQLSRGKIDLSQLGYEYNRQVQNSGSESAKAEVYNSKLKAIPGAPQNVTPKTIHESESLSLIISWHKPSKNFQAVTEYRVQVSCNKCTKQEVLSVEQNETKTKIENVICNAVYSVEVCSFNRLMKGECSEPVQVRTPPGRPCKPQKPKIILTSAIGASATIPALSEEEENGSQVKELKIFVGGNNIKKEKWKQHRCVVTDRQNEYLYQIDIPNTEECSETSHVFVQVQMFNDAGGSDLSDFEKIPVTDLIPGPPQSLEAHSTARDITVTWKPGYPNSAAAAYYLVEFKEKDGSWQIKHNRYREFSYTFTGLKPASTYIIRIGTGNRLYEASEVSMDKKTVNTLPDRPSRPPQPAIQIDEQLKCSSKGWLVSAKLHKEKENGSPVQEVIVQQRTNDHGEWHKQSFKIQQGASDIRQPITLLKAELETKVIYFQTIMKNDCGESDSSDVCTLDPSTMIPGPPSKLSAVASYSSVTLTWEIPQENPASVDKYFIEMKSGEKWEPSTNVTHQDFFTTVRGLSPKRMYEFRAYTKNKDNIKLLDRYSNTVTVNTKPCKPKKPERSDISLDVERFDKAVLTLLKPRLEDSGSNIIMVKVMQYSEKKLNLDRQSEHKISEEELNNESDSLYLIVKIDPCTHFIRVILVNEVDKSDPSEFVGVATSSIIPGVPQDFCYIDQLRKAKQLTLKWNPPDKNERAAKQYVIEMEIYDELVEGAEPIARWRPIEFKHEIKENEHFATISELVPCKKYTFRLCAVNDKIKGQYTENIDVITIGSRPDNPPKPYVVQSDTHPDKAIVTIHMLEKEKQNGSSITKVTVEVSENLQNWQPYNFDINAIIHQKVEVNLPNLNVIHDERNHFRIYFCVTMWNEFGQSGRSEEVSLPFSVLRPGEVQEFQATCKKAHNIELHWKPPRIHLALVSNYVVQKTTHSLAGNSITWKEEMIVDSRQNDMEVITASIAEPRMNVDCKLRVMAKNKEVNGLCSEKQVHVPDVIPGTPVNLREDKIQPRRIKVRWQQPTDKKEAVSEYKIEVLSVKTNTPIGDPLFTKKLSKVITNLDPLTQYKVKVTAMNVSRQSSPSAETTVKTVMRDGWRYFFNGITAGQAARRPDQDSDLMSSGDEES